MDRQQPTAEIDDASLRLLTRSEERSADAGSTLVGGIDDPFPARVDRGGLVSPAGASWSFDWWVGADDRWYFPAREPSVRQRRNGPGPVIETSMRVPSGDVVATAYPVVVGARRATVVEIENASPVPVALAVAVRPVPLDGGPSRSHRLELVDGPATPASTSAPVSTSTSMSMSPSTSAPVSSPVITVDGRPAVLLPRSPSERVADGRHDVLDRVEGGRDLAWDGAIEGPGANAACVYPLPHGTSLRFVLPGPDRANTEAQADVSPIRIDALPPAETVASGWASIIDRAGTFDFPDPGLTELVGAARARLVLAAPGLPGHIEALDHDAALVLEALAVGGHGHECGPSLERLAAAFPTALPADTERSSAAMAGAATIRAAAAAAQVVDSARADELLESVAQLTSLVERRGDQRATAVAKRGLAALVDRAGQPDAARHLRATIDGSVASSAADLDDVTAQAMMAGPSGSWPPNDDARSAARFLIAARGLLLDVDHGTAGEVPADESGFDRPVIRLLPSMPAAWLGGEVEVHRAPAAGVRVSFAIRWHGYRPALLWEIHDDVDVVPQPGPGPGPRPRPRPGSGPRRLLCCPALDPDWSTEASSGETLLAGTAIELPEAPGPGDSFQ